MLQYFILVKMSINALNNLVVFSEKERSPRLCPHWLCGSRGQKVYRKKTLHLAAGLVPNEPVVPVFSQSSASSIERDGPNFGFFATALNCVE